MSMHNILKSHLLTLSTTNLCVIHVKKNDNSNEEFRFDKAFEEDTKLLSLFIYYNVITNK
jgi:hypothetical protein